MQEYWRIVAFVFILSSTFNRYLKTIEFVETEKQFLSRLMTRIHRNPFYFYNLNPAFKIGLIDSPALYVKKSPILFGLKIQPEHELKQQFTNNQFHLHSNTPLTTQSQQINTQFPNNHLKPFQNDQTFLYPSSPVSSLNLPSTNLLTTNPFIHTNPFEQQDLNKRNQLFHNRVGSLDESELFDNQSDGHLNDPHYHQIGHWCNKQMQQVLQPYCFCGKNRLTKNSVICSNVPSEPVLRRTLHAAGLLLNVEGIYRISKLRIFNSTIDNLNIQTLPETLKFMLIQMNKCGLTSLDHLNVFHGSVQLKIDLSNNELEEFPFDELYQFNGLFILKLSYNHLKNVPDDALKDCYKLRMLDLSFNQLNYIGNHAFRGAFNLKFLDLRFNRLKVLNNYALAFQPSSLIYSINLSHNQMRLIGENAFDNLIVHKLYLNNNRLKKFPENLFKPILDNMVKINIEQKLLSSPEIDLNSANANAFISFDDGKEILYRNFAFSISNQTIDKDKIGKNNNVRFHQTEMNNTLKNGLMNNNDLNLGQNNLIFRNISSDEIELVIRHLNESLTLNPPLDYLSQTLLDNFYQELTILTKMNLSTKSWTYLAEDLIFDEFSHFDKFLEKLRTHSQFMTNKAKTKSTSSIDSPLNHPKNVLPEISSDSLHLSNSFREEIKANHSLVYFDDELEHRQEFLNNNRNSISPSYLDFDDDHLAASIQLSDNDFQCTCDGFEWLFKLNYDQLKALKGFQCSNLPGQKKFASIDQLTPLDINCWDY